MFAEFDHTPSQGRHAFPTSCNASGARSSKRRWRWRSAHPYRRCRCDDLHRASPSTRTGSSRTSSNRRAKRSRSRQIHRQLRRRAQQRPQGARHRVRGLHLSRSHAQHRGRLRFRRHGYAERNYLSDPDQWSNLFIRVRPSAGACISRPTHGRSRQRHAAGALQARLQRFLPPAAFDIVPSKLYTVHQRVARRSAPGAPSWPATPRM